MPLPQSVTPQIAQQLLKMGAVLVDVRLADEYAREHIPHSVSCPVASLNVDKLQEVLSGANSVIFLCLSGMRSSQHRAQLAEAAGAAQTYLLSGGLQAWKRAGLPIMKGKRPTIDIMRQVQIVAGATVLAGVILGQAMHPAFYWLAGFVGAGLLFSGVSGYCGLARVLMRMPWNRER
ncbi:rhodanese family protein [Lonsdalea quercina]|uniref:rhodanese family protein n=1 Tax=Lonsdalea quercina TaxID=71657 RepID=UPI00397682A0